MKQKLFIIIILLAMLTSCKKSSVDTGNFSITALVLDWDSKTPLPGAKVYLAYPLIAIPPFGSPWKIYDSAITDASGKAVFTSSIGENGEAFAISKPGYLQAQTKFNVPFSFKNEVARTDTCYLAKPSFVNLTVHNYRNIYLPGDSVEIKVRGHSNSAGQRIGVFQTVLIDFANSPDRLINLQAFYLSPYFTRLDFEFAIIRNSTIIDYVIGPYVEMTQFGTVNCTLDY